MKPGSPLLNLSIGQPYPAGYGYIRRYVVIKQNSNATINMAQRPEFDATREDQICAITNPCQEQFTIHLDGTVLYNSSIGTPYKLDLQREPLIINVTGLHSILNNSDPGYNFNPSPIANTTGEWATNTHGNSITAPTWATLTGVDFGIPGNYNLWTNMMPKVHLSADGVTQPFPLGGAKVQVRDSVNLSLDYVDANFFGSAKPLDITLTFNDNPDLPHSFIHGVYLYDYNQTNVTQPVLSTGMLEVGIW